MKLILNLTSAQMSSLDELAIAFEKSSREEAVHSMITWYLELRKLNETKRQLHNEIANINEESQLIEKLILKNGEK